MRARHRRLPTRPRSATRARGRSSSPCEPNPRREPGARTGLRHASAATGDDIALAIIGCEQYAHVEAERDARFAIQATLDAEAKRELGTHEACRILEVVTLYAECREQEQLDATLRGGTEL